MKEQGLSVSVNIGAELKPNQIDVLISALDELKPTLESGDTILVEVSEDSKKIHFTQLICPI